MWFRNLRFYTFSERFEFPENFEARLAEHVFHPCSRQELASYGWYSPFGNQSELLAHQLGGDVLLCARKEEKVLPASAINTALEEKVAALSAEQGRPVNRKEKQSMKEDLIHMMLPQAFSKYQLTWGYISTEQQMIAIDASSANKAEAFLALLRSSFSSLPVKPWLTDTPVEQSLTTWLQQQQLPEGFSFGEEAELRDSAEDGGILRCRQQELTSQEMQIHLEHGKQVTKLGVGWQERLNFVIESDLALKRFKLTDVAENDRDDLVDPTPEQKIDADFALLSSEVNALFPALRKAFQGAD